MDQFREQDIFSVKAKRVYFQGLHVLHVYHWNVLVWVQMKLSAPQLMTQEEVLFLLQEVSVPAS